MIDAAQLIPTIDIELQDGTNEMERLRVHLFDDDTFNIRPGEKVNRLDEIGGTTKE